MSARIVMSGLGGDDLYQLIGHGTKEELRSALVELIAGLSPGPWRFDVPEVPAHVTAVEDHRGWVWVRDGAVWLVWREATVIPAGTGAFAYRLHDGDLIARAPLVECPDPRAAS